MRKRHRPEQVIPNLRQAEADLASGLTIAQVCQKLGISEPTYHRWQARYGGPKVHDAKRLRELEAENDDRPLPQMVFVETAQGEHRTVERNEDEELH